MKIGIDLRTLMSASYSGIPGFTYNLLQNILPIDPNNEYVGFLNSFNQKYKRIPNLENKIKTYNYSTPNKIFNFSQRFLAYPKIDAKLQADVFYMPHINFISLGSRSYKIITVHDLSFIRYPDFFSFKKNLWHKSLAVEKVLRQVDKIVAISNNTKNDLIELLGVPEEKISVIYSGVNDKFRPLPDNDPELKKIKEKYGLPNKFILYLGTIEPRKNIDGLIRAFNDFKTGDSQGYKLIIAGGLGWKYKKILKLRNSCRYADDIKFSGFVDENDKNALYNLADFFVFPSFYEGFGFPPLEAMKAGTPVISSANSSLLEVLGNSALLLDPHNMADLSAGLKIFAESPEIKRKYRARGFQAAQKYIWADAAKAYLRLFEQKNI